MSTSRQTLVRILSEFPVVLPADNNLDELCRELRDATTELSLLFDGLTELSAADIDSALAIEYGLDEVPD